MTEVITFTLFFLFSACIIVPVFVRFKLSPILGYLAAGALIGPWGFRLAEDSAALYHVAELGVIFLLFIIGLELKPARLWALRRAIFGSGQLQFVLTALILAGIGFLFYHDYRVILVAGLGFALSSTAICAQMLSSKGLLNTYGGRLAFAILLFQDLVVIPVMAFLPLLGQGADHINPSLAETLKALLVFGLLVVVGRYLLRPLMYYVVNLRMRELNTAVALCLVLSSALLMNYVGLSAALGAFLAGVLLADSEYRHAIQSDIKPFEGLLMGLFFIVVGMRINFGLLQQIPFFVIGLTSLLILCKFLVVYFIAIWQKLPKVQALQIGLLLSQGGEFAFVVFTHAVSSTVMERDIADILSLIVTLSMVMTPVLWLGYEMFAVRWAKQQQKSQKIKADVDEDEIDNLNNPVIVAGFDRFGQIIARLLAANNIGITILSSDPEILKKLRTVGITGFFGDAMRLEILEAAGLAEAKLLIIAKDSPEITTELAQQVKLRYPHIKILARAYDTYHLFELEDAGVDHVEREVQPAAVNVGVAALRFLGMDGYLAFRAGQKFTYHEAEAVRLLKPLMDNENSFLSEAMRFQKELEKLLQDDKKWNAHQLEEDW